jgi:hypothetical protein
MANFSGTQKAKFTFTVSSGTIVNAFLEVPGQAKAKLPVSADGQGVTVNSLPAGASGVRLDLVWAPADADAVVNLGTVITGTVTRQPADPILIAGDTPGLVTLSGA